MRVLHPHSTCPYFCLSSPLCLWEQNTLILAFKHSCVLQLIATTALISLVGNSAEEKPYLLLMLYAVGSLLELAYFPDNMRDLSKEYRYMSKYNCVLSLAKPHKARILHQIMHFILGGGKERAEIIS